MRKELKIKVSSFYVKTCNKLLPNETNVCKTNAKFIKKSLIFE